MAELSALADGTLPADRRGAVEARIAASSELRELFERQQRAVTAAQTLAMDEVPESLRTAVDAHRRTVGSHARSRRLAPRIGLAVAVVAAAAAVAAILLNHGPGSPTVADAATLATQRPSAPAPPAAGKAGTRLAIAVEGVPFPDLAAFAGWRADGVLSRRIDGRDATVVYYRKDGRHVGYVIVAGAGLARPETARTTYIRRVGYQTLRVDDRLAVTWRRGGHTCVLVGQATRGELLKLASWPLTPRR